MAMKVNEIQSEANFQGPRFLYPTSGSTLSYPHHLRRKVLGLYTPMMQTTVASTKAPAVSVTLLAFT